MSNLTSNHLANSNTVESTLLLTDMDTKLAYSVFDSLTSTIAILNHTGNIVKVNKSWKNFALQNNAKSEISTNWNYLDVCEKSFANGSQDAGKMLTGIKSLLSNEFENFNMEYACHSPTQQRWFLARVSKFEVDGNPYIVVKHENITDRKQAELSVQSHLNEKEIILKEVHHRIKNNFSSIEGMIYLQMEACENTEAIDALKDASSRVKSMRILYQKMLLGENYKFIYSKEYLNSLIDVIVQIAPSNLKLTLTKNIDDFQLTSNKAFILGIIVNELITNALKHAFSSRLTGKLQVDFSKRDNLVTITISDDGKGFNNNTTNEGFGLNLTAMLVRQLDGRIQFIKDNGMKVIIEFSLD